MTFGTYDKVVANTSQASQTMPIENLMSLDEIRAAYESNEYGAGADLLIQNLLAHAERMDRRLHIYERIIEEISRIYDNA